MKKFIICILTLLFNGSAFAQLTIEKCYEKAHVNYPLIEQYDLINKSEKYNLSNAAKGYLPQISFSAKASYQSEVTELPIPLEGIGALSKDQYNLAVDVNQVIWDGGAIRAKKEEVRTSSEVSVRSIDVELYSLNNRVNQLYFGILLFDAQLEQNRLYQEELQRNYDKIKSCVNNGIANHSDLDAVKVEQLKAIQNKSKLFHSKVAYLDMLSAMIGEKIENNVGLVKPDATLNTDTSIKRPELELYIAQIKNLEIQNKQLQSSLMPKIGVYATGGYGRPGLNMLNNDFSSYYIAGARLTWNIGNFYTNKNSKQLIQNNINSIKTQQQTFLFNTELDITNRQSNIDNYIEQLKYDNDIIKLRNSIKQSSETKMNNGTISGIDFMRDVNAEDLAKQDKIFHEIELLLAIYTLKYTQNN